jgi:hypothetical protein
MRTGIVSLGMISDGSNLHFRVFGWGRTVSLVSAAEWGQISAFGRLPLIGLAFWPDLGWPFLCPRVETCLPPRDRLEDADGRWVIDSGEGTRERRRGRGNFKIFLSCIDQRPNQEGDGRSTAALEDHLH